MTLPELSIKRHVLAFMMSAVLVLFGIISYERIGMDRFPYIEFPIVSITTTLKGANPDIVDSSITNLIETSVNSVPGIEHIQSSSSPGVSVIAITFDLDKKIDVAFNEVQAKVNQVLRRLPQDTDPPVVAKVETNAMPIMWLALRGDRTQQQLNQYALNIIKKRLETIDGVGEVRLGGRRDRTIRVDLLPAKMAALQVTAQDISNAFSNEHVQIAGGFLVGQKTENLIKLDLEFHRLDDLAQMIVAYRDGSPIKLKDVAEISDGLTDNRQLARFMGETTVGLGIVKVTNTNTVAIIDDVKKRLESEIIPQLPPGMTLSIVSNDAVFIQEIVDSLKQHLIEGTLLASLVVWLFLRSIRSTLIIATAIPVSLLGAVAVIYFAGFTLNSLTMLALLLLIGVVVDDAIVVLENIFRHMEMAKDVSAQANMSAENVKSAEADGRSQNIESEMARDVSAQANMSAENVKSAEADGRSQNIESEMARDVSAQANMSAANVKSADADGQSQNIFRHREEGNTDRIDAAIVGSKEVIFAVMAATLSLVSIFAPVIFLGGIIGQFFKSFAVVVTFGVLVSLFVSLTLTPMLCSRFLNVTERHGRIFYFLEGLFRGLDNAYRYLLGKALKHRWKVVVLTVAIVASSSYFFVNVGKTFVPEEDEGRFMVNLKTPLGSSIDYTDSRLRMIEAILLKHEDIVTEFALIGLGQAGQVNQGLVVVRMAPRLERTVKQQDVVQQLRQEFAQIPGARIFVAPYPIVGGVRGEQLQFVVSGLNLERVGQLSQQLQQTLAAEPGLGKIDMDLQLGLPQLELTPDRTRIAAAGLSTQDVALALNMLSGGIDIARYNDIPGDGQRYYIRVKAKEGEFNQISDLNRIYLRSRDGSMVRLDTVTGVKQTTGAAVIGRFDLQYAATFFASPTIPLGDAVNKVKQAAAQILPPGYSVKMIGQAEEFGKTVKYMIFAFSLALVLIYMVLASQFNSFVQPFIIMVAQPLAIIGGVMGLWLFNHTLNIYSMIGMVLLIGLVAKNSILLVDLTNQRREQGYDIDSALRNACPIRMRPVLMTSLTVILALLPAALGLGAGAETNGPLAVAVICGMITSTLLTLVVVPAVYSLAMHGMERVQRRFVS